MTESQYFQPAQADMVLVNRAILERALHTAMMSAMKARAPECGHFGEIAQDLDALLSPAEAIPAPEGGELPALPHPLLIAGGGQSWFSADQMRAYARAALAAQPQAPLPERAILDLVPSNMPLSNDFELLWFARAVERAHGIQTKEPTNDR